MSNTDNDTPATPAGLLLISDSKKCFAKFKFQEWIVAKTDKGNKVRLNGYICSNDVIGVCRTTFDERTTLKQMYRNHPKQDKMPIAEHSYIQQTEFIYDSRKSEDENGFIVTEIYVHGEKDVRHTLKKKTETSQWNSYPKARQRE